LKQIRFRTLKTLLILDECTPLKHLSLAYCRPGANSAATGLHSWV